MSYVVNNAHWFVLLIGALVFFHELGHFLVAKAFDVKVVRFSLGFGPKLVAFTYGETEYTISLLPFGGYVKMVGEDPNEVAAEDDGRALSQKPLWQRSAIVIAGPVFNMLLALVIYAVMFGGAHTFGATKLGIVTAGEPAYEAGIRPGDKIVAVQGREVERWEQLQAAIAAHPLENLAVTYEREGVRHEAQLQTQARGEEDVLGQLNQRGKAGISLQFVRPRLAIVDPTGPAARAGVLTGDVVTAVDGTKVEAWHELRAALQRAAAAGRREVALALLRGQVPIEVRIAASSVPEPLAEERFSDANLPGKDGYLGLVSQDVVVARVEADTPAARAGLRPGDRIRTLVVHAGEAQGGAVVRRPVGVWGVDLAAFGLTEATQLGLEVQRGHDVQTLTVHLVARNEVDEYHQARPVLILGAQNAEDTLGVYTYEAPVRPLAAIAEAARQVGDDATLIGRGIYKMARGEVPLKSMGGPIMLFVIAEKSAKRGWESFGRALAMTSVNLGMLNILPVPVLDGGHLLFYAIEAITRRPPSLRVREAANFVGLALLLALMVVVFRNDISRFLLGAA